MDRPLVSPAINNDLDWLKARHLAEGFRRMVAEQAWGVWRRLPKHTRAWLSIEDLVEDGLNWATTVGLAKWEPKRGSLHTWLFCGLRTYFDNTYLSWYLTKKRHEGAVVSLTPEGPQSDTLVVPGVLPEATIRDCYVVSLMMGVYKEASERLKRQIERWFLGDLERLHLKSPEFVRVSTEFRVLAKQCDLHYEECRHLMRSPKCLDQLSRELRWVPFDMNDPTPGLRSCRA